MGILFALLSVFGASLTTSIDRLNIKRNRISAQREMFLVFLAMSTSLLLFVVFTHQRFPSLSLPAFALMASIVLISFAANTCDYLSIKANDLSLREPLTDFEPIAAGLIGYVAFPAERKPAFLIALLLSMMIVYWGTHRRKLRKFQARGMFFLLLAVFLEGMLPSLYKLTLTYLSPAYITLFRVVVILVLVQIFHPKTKKSKLTPKNLSYGLLSGIACSMGAVTALYAIGSLGVVVTMLLMLLGPFVRYSAAYFVMKEKVRKGEVASSLLLAGTVITSVLK